MIPSFLYEWVISLGGAPLALYRNIRCLASFHYPDFNNRRLNFLGREGNEITAGNAALNEFSECTGDGGASSNYFRALKRAEN